MTSRGAFVTVVESFLLLLSKAVALIMTILAYAFL